MNWWQPIVFVSKGRLCSGSKAAAGHTDPSLHCITLAHEVQDFKWSYNALVAVLTGQSSVSMRPGSMNGDESVAWPRPITRRARLCTALQLRCICIPSTLVHSSTAKLPSGGTRARCAMFSARLKCGYSRTWGVLSLKTFPYAQ